MAKRIMADPGSVASPRPISVRAGRLRRYRGALLLPLLLLGPGCRMPQETAIEVRLYDLSGARLLRCSLTPSGKNQNQGAMRCQAPGGEVYQGEWIKLNINKSSSRTSSGGSSSQSSLPSVPGTVDTSTNTLAWATDMGIDFDHFPSTYFTFILNSNQGTLIDGFFLDNSSSGGMFAHGGFISLGLPSGGLLGAARDNRGHRYKLMG